MRVVTVLNARRAWVTVLLPQGEERFEPVVPFGWKLLTKNPKLICAGVDGNVSMEEVLIFITPTILPTRAESGRRSAPLPQSPAVLTPGSR